MLRMRLSAAVFAVSLALTAEAQSQTKYVAPYNLVVVVLDTSISFQLPATGAGIKGRVPVNEAIQVAEHLFDASGSERRRRKVAEDRYVIVAVDAASQVIWRGDRKQLGGLAGGALTQILKVRRQFAYCTDYESGMNAAAKVIRENADATNYYVLTFGDLIHEPSTTSYRACAAPTGKPPANIDWDTLQYASLGFYFVSTDFKLRPNQHWPALLDSRGIHADFKDMAQTMTQAVEVPPPPRAVYRPSQEQVDEAQQRWARLKQLGLKAGKGFLGVASLGLISLFGLIVFARRKTAGQVTK